MVKHIEKKHSVTHGQIYNVVNKLQLQHIVKFIMLYKNNAGNIQISTIYNNLKKLNKVPL